MFFIFRYEYRSLMGHVINAVEVFNGIDDDVDASDSDRKLFEYNRFHSFISCMQQTRVFEESSVKLVRISEDNLRLVATKNLEPNDELILFNPCFVSVDTGCINEYNIKSALYFASDISGEKSSSAGVLTAGDNMRDIMTELYQGLQKN